MTLPVELPPPRDWQVFEDFCWELFQAEWGDPHATKYGRSGEDQNGVDIVGRRDGGWHAVQCKRRGLFPEKTLAAAEVRAEVERSKRQRKKGKQQRRKLDSLVIATTAPPSVELSDVAAELTETSGLRVEVYCWEELTRRLQQQEALFLRWSRLLGGAGGPTFYGVPLRNAYFQGRAELLEQLAQSLGTATVFALTQAVHGLGGVGKTQIAIEYCHRYAGRYTHVIWADASSPETLSARYAELARLTGRVPPAAPAEEAAGSFLAWLSSEDSWLLVLDNVEDRPEELPRPEGRSGHVLITSRLQQLPPKLGAGQPVQVEVLPIDEAVAFLLQRTGRMEPGAEEAAAARTLAGELGGLPLALEQASAYIVEIGLSFGKYLGLLRSKREVLALEEGSYGLAGGYAKDVASTWLLNMEQIPPAAREVMDICAFLAPDRIPLSLFVEQAELAGPELSALGKDLQADPAAAHRHLVRPLTRFSLFRFDPEREVFAVHRMVQWVARRRLEAEGEAIGVLQRAHTAVESAFPSEGTDPSTWLECSLLLNHVVALHQRWSEAPPIVGFDPTQLWANAARFARVSGRSAEALHLARSVVEVCRGALGEEHRDTLVALSQLAVTRTVSGDVEGARQLHEKVAECFRRVLGEEHPDTLTSMNNLAESRRALGDAAGARQLHEEVVEARRRVLGEEHADTLQSLNNLAATRWTLGDAAGARKLLEEVVEIRCRVLGEEHPDTLQSLNNLAAAHSAMGDAEGARQLLEQVLDVSRRVLGEEHPDTLTSLSNLAATRWDLGDAEARRLFEEVVEVRRRVLGGEHPDTLTSLHNVAETRRAFGDIAGARQLFAEVVEVRRRVLGEEHPDTLTSLNKLAETLSDSGDAAGARQLFTEVVEIRRRALGEEHPDTLTSLNNLAETYLAVGDAAGARQLLEKVVEVSRRVLGAHHPYTVTYAANLAGLLEPGHGKA